MSTTSGVVAPSELQILLTDVAPLESAGAAVRACALSKGFEAERATRLQVVVEELIRECRMREPGRRRLDPPATGQRPSGSP